MKRFVPGVFSGFRKSNALATANDTTIGFVQAIKTAEMNVYAEDEIKISSRFSLNLGVRATGYFCKDTAFYRLEPRVSLLWKLSDRLSFKAGYSEMNQYNHVLVNNASGLEREIWMAVTKEQQPQHAAQIAGGLFYADKNIGIDISVECFYKKMKHLLEYRSPVDLDLNLNNINDIVVNNGIGRAYGIELGISKDFRNFSAVVGYTWSKSERRFTALNGGAWYPSLYDRPHDLSLVGIWKISEKWTVSADFVYSTGSPVTFPIAYSKSDDYVAGYHIHDGMNNRRLPDYHRCDLSVARKWTDKKGLKHQLSFNIFNVYARQNAVAIKYRNNGKVYQIANFSIIPTINYSLIF